MLPTCDPCAPVIINSRAAGTVEVSSCNSVVSSFPLAAFLQAEDESSVSLLKTQTHDENFD
jgi:hypothetical protein